MATYEQTGECLWCHDKITRTAHHRAPWIGETAPVAQCNHRADGKYYHEPAEDSPDGLRRQASATVMRAESEAEFQTWKETFND